MNKVKILYIHHGTTSGGAPRSLSFLINNLDKSVYDPYVLCFYDEEKNRKLFESVGATVLYEHWMRPWHGSVVSGMSSKLFKDNILGAIPSYVNMAKIVRKVKPDIVHLNSTCLFIQARAIKKYDSEIPIVCHVREPLLPNIWGKILRVNNEKYIDEYIAIEKYDAESIQPTSKKINIIYNFVDSQKYNCKIKSDFLRNKIGLKTDDKVFLYLARICKQNGALEMAKAASKISATRKDIHFCIVGVQENDTSEYNNELISFCKDYQSNIHLLPYTNDVPSVLASCDVVVVPFQEPHSARSIIEASAMGKPVIASDIGGPQEMVIDGQTGFLFDYKTFQDFEEKVLLLADNPDLRETMGAEALKLSEMQYSEKKNAEKTFDIYDRLLSSV